jgi:multicomponent Na+:H+ antiporter subunit E
MKIFQKYIIKAGRLIWFIILYILDLIIANIIIAKEILSFNPKIKPGFIKIELDARTDQEILALTNLISMTPGSLTIDISDDKKYLFIHEMYLDDVDKAKQQLKEKLENRILKITR